MRTCWLYPRYLGASKPGRIRQTSAKLGKRWLDAVESRSFKRIEAPPLLVRSIHYRCRLQSSRRVSIRNDISAWPNCQIPQCHSHSFTGKRNRSPVSRSSPRNSFRLIHERRQSSCSGTLEGTMNFDESMITMEISCIVLRLYSLRAIGICRYLYRFFLLNRS